MIVIIIADSFKKGMKSRGCAGLLPYNKHTNLIQQQYAAITKVFPKADIVYVYGFDAKRFDNFIHSHKSLDIEFIQNKDYENYSHGKSLSVVKNHIANSRECLIMLGYDPIYVKDIKPIKDIKKSSVLLADNSRSKIGCVVDQHTGSIHHLFFDLENHISDTYLLKTPEIKILIDLLQDNSIYNMFLFEIMNKILHNSGHLQAI